MRNKILLIVVFFLLAVFIPTYVVRAAECIEPNSTDQKVLEEIRDACERKVQSLREQKNTLAGEVKYIDTQTYLTQVEINQNEQQIVKMREEIEKLGERIDEIDTTVDKVSEVVSRKIGEIYKKQKSNTVYALLDTNNLPSFLRSLEYLQKSQENDRHLLLKLQNNKVTFQEQQSLREQKEEELQNAIVKLESYKVTLSQQQQTKKNLLAITQNDETKYQQILAEAKAQIAGFKSFVSSTGAGGVVSANGLGTGYDNNYYSQRDQRWAYVTIGNSQETIKEVGCLLTSVAMVLKAKGVDVNPVSIASNTSYFWLDSAYMLYRYQISLPGGKTGRTIGTSEIDTYLSNNEPVIVGVHAGSYGTHFIVLKKKDGDNWVMFDPVYGPDKKFTDYYSSGQIFSAEIII